MPARRKRPAAVAVITGLIVVCSAARGTAVDDAFVDFEAGQTRPLAIAPDESRLFALNTPDNRLSIFDIDSSGLQLAAEVPVGLEPVALATRVNAGGRTEVWVVNHLSDSVSVVEIDALDVTLSRVVRTLHVGDEPRDIVFAGPEQSKAFITTARRGQNLPPGLSPRFNDEGVPRALVWVFDAEAPGSTLGGSPSTILELFGDTPRALAASPDGSTVYAAIFHSGNRTTVMHENTVTNNGGLPPLPADSPYVDDELPSNALIVRFDPSTGEWNDEVARDWSPFVLFSLPDFDVLAIDADADPPELAQGISSFSGVGTTLFNLAVHPADGSVFVSNTEAFNDVRFEPIEAGGVQGHLTETRITVIDGMSVTPVHVNPHIDYGVATGPPAEVAESLAFLNDMVFSSDGATLYVAALGSNQVAAFDAAALASGVVGRDLIDVGEGPNGVALDELRDRLYVLNRLESTISVVTDVSNPGLRVESAVVPIGHDPTPAVVREGRRFLYDARETSGHGDAACASCHVFGDVDHLAWDLGDPYGDIIANPNDFVDSPIVAPPVPPPFHPVKGPMTTQSLRGLAGAGAMHWRGDRTAGNDVGGDPEDAVGAFEKFNPAFVDLLGRATQLSAAEMQAFTDFVMTLRYPPNPVRAFDGELRPNELDGLEIFLTLEDEILEAPCQGCHALPLGTDRRSAVEITDTFKVPHLRNLYQKVGMFGADRFGPPNDGFKGDQVRAFGYVNDGSQPTLLDFVEGFNMPAPLPAKVTAFLFAFDTGLHPAVGQQVTLRSDNVSHPEVLARLDLLRDRNAAGDCDLAVSATVDGEPRTGVVTSDAEVRLDRSSEALLSGAAFAALATQPGGEQTYTCHPAETRRRVGIDRDGDGVSNGDERDEGFDPGDPSSVPFDCLGGALEQIERVKMKIDKNAVPSGDERITVKGEWLPPSGAPAIDLVANGLNVLLRDAGGRIVLHRRVVEADSPVPAGWAAAASGNKWSYKTKPGTLGGGIFKARLVVKRDGTAKLLIKGKASDFRVDTGDLRLEVVLGGDAQASTGQCATRTFNAGAGAPVCVLDAKRLKCR